MKRLLRWARKTSLSGVFLACLWMLFGQGSEAGVDGLLSSLNAYADTSSERTALIIGNAAYADAPLANAINDANDMADKLTELGFNVTKRTNLGRRELGAAITDFVREVRGKDGVALFYYSGHGLQLSGKNYMVPVDARIRDALDVSNEAMPIVTLMAGLEYRGEHAINLLLLDACRDNPFLNRDQKSLGYKGLAQMSAPKGTLVLYATSPGETASDNSSGRNSLFTQHLLQAIDQPGLEIKDAFQQIAHNVYNDSNNTQLPWQEGMIFGRFFFRSPINLTRPSLDNSLPSLAAPAVPAQEGSTADALAYWHVIEDSGEATAYRAFISRFNDPVLTALARAKLRELETDRQTPSSAVSPEPDMSETAALARTKQLPPLIIQYALFELGHYQGQLDGLIGPGTRSAIQAFQSSKGFVVSGEMTPAQKVNLIKSAAQAGHPHSQNALGMMTASGVGVVKDEIAARKWFRAAANQGNGYAAYNLGVLYRDGQGGSRSLDEARRYFEQAKADGYRAAVTALKEMDRLKR